nr:hypothetical protein [Panacibacter microcysteis]
MDEALFISFSVSNKAFFPLKTGDVLKPLKLVADVIKTVTASAFETCTDLSSAVIVPPSFKTFKQTPNVIPLPESFAY